MNYIGILSNRNITILLFRKSTPLKDVMSESWTPIVRSLNVHNPSLYVHNPFLCLSTCAKLLPSVRRLNMERKKQKRITLVNFSFEYSLCRFKIRSGTTEIVTQVSTVIPLFFWPATNKQRYKM